MTEASALEATLRESVKSAILTAAATPQKLADLKKAAKNAVTAKKDKKLAEAVVEELIAAGDLHKHGTTAKALYGKDKPADPNDPEKVNAALLEAAATPQKLAKLVKATAKLTKADESFVTDQANTLIANQQLHKHGAGENSPYGKHKPADPNDPEKVNAALLEAAATPQAVAKLVAAAVKATKASKEFATGQANQLIASEQLHKHGKAKSAPYGREKPKPPHPLEVEPGNKAYAAFVKAAKKLREVVPGVSFDEVIERLRSALANEVVKPQLTEPPPPPPVAPPLALRKPEPVTEAITPERIRIGLKAAYDELCLFPEFEDKLVELRRLYHAAVGLLPGLTVTQFHRELEHLQSQRQIELHALNEVQRAQEPQLAISHGDRLLYFAIWR